MDKRALAKTTRREASADTISQAKRIEAVKAYISAEVIDCGDKRILLLNICLKSDLMEDKAEAAYRVFIDKDDYITQDLRSKATKWLTGRLTSILDVWNTGEYCAFADDASCQTVLEFLESDSTPFAAIEKFQRSVLEKRLAAKHKKITDIIDAKMALVPELPDDWQEWIEKTTIPNSRYIFYDYKKGKTAQKGRCTYCNSSVEAEKPRYGKEGVCPACKSKIIFKSCKKAGTVIWDDGQAAIIQRVGDEIVIRSFQLKRTHRPIEGIRSITRAHEVTRDFFVPKLHKVYEWRKFKSTNTVRWCEDAQIHYLAEPIVYEKNINEVISGTNWQYSGLHQYATRHPGATVNIFKFFCEYHKHPFIEYLIKLRLYRLVDEMLHRVGHFTHHVNKNGKSLTEILGVGKELLPVLQELDADDRDLSLIQSAAKAKYRLTADEFRKFVEKNGHNPDLFKMTCYATVHRITRYLDERSVGKDRNNVFRDFADYIRYCEELEYDLKNEFVLFPKALKKAHDLTYKRVLAVREKKKKAYRKELDAKSVKYFSGLQKRYGWENGSFVVIAPGSLFEIIKEGQRLHHCVGAHAEKAARGETIILFLRKKDEPAKPFYTIEVIKDRVTQCRGRNNSDMPDEIKKVINAFSREVIQMKGVSA